MNGALRDGLESELKHASLNEQQAVLERAWQHVERAHDLSQAHAGPHVRVHLRMLAFGWGRCDRQEVIGQLARILVAAPGSWMGRAPLRNTGGADVGILTPTAIPEDLRQLLSVVPRSAVIRWAARLTAGVLHRVRAPDTKTGDVSHDRSPSMSGVVTLRSAP